MATVQREELTQEYRFLPADYKVSSVVLFFDLINYYIQTYPLAYDLDVIRTHLTATS